MFLRCVQGPLGPQGAPGIKVCSRIQTPNHNIMVQMFIHRTSGINFEQLDENVQQRNIPRKVKLNESTT